MAISQAICTSFKSELAQALHDFTTSTGDVFKLALYTSGAAIGASTTVYTSTSEVSSSGTGYTTGGNDLTNVTPVISGTTAYTDFADSTWLASAITARGAMIYNSSNSNRAVMILDFGSDKVSSSGDFTVLFPTADSSSAIIRIT